VSRTIVVLGYNRPDCLRRCLTALARCRSISKFDLRIFIDGGKDSMSLESVNFLPEKERPISWFTSKSPTNYGINHHNKWAVDRTFAESPDTDFVVLLEDDCVLTPDALELAMNFHGLMAVTEANLCAYPYHFASLGDPDYRKSPPADADYDKILETQGLYTSGWCFTRAGWSTIRERWNRLLRTQIGWDYSLSYTAWEQKWRSLAPLVSRAQNIGRIGAHSTAEFFDANVAASTFSDGRKFDRFTLAHVVDVTSTPPWIADEVAAKEDMMASVRAALEKHHDICR
jgi:hypothetical protein